MVDKRFDDRAIEPEVNRRNPNGLERMQAQHKAHSQKQERFDDSCAALRRFAQ
jgi:hypothetical protein